MGRSWPLLGRSWDALGSLLAALGRSWGANSALKALICSKKRDVHVSFVKITIAFSPPRLCIARILLSLPPSCKSILPFVPFSLEIFRYCLSSLRPVMAYRHPSFLSLTFLVSYISFLHPAHQCDIPCFPSSSPLHSLNIAFLRAALPVHILHSVPLAFASLVYCLPSLRPASPYCPSSPSHLKSSDIAFLPSVLSWHTAIRPSSP